MSGLESKFEKDRERFARKSDPSDLAARNLSNLIDAAGDYFILAKEVARFLTEVESGKLRSLPIGAGTQAECTESILKRLVLDLEDEGAMRLDSWNTAHFQNGKSETKIQPRNDPPTAG